MNLEVALECLIINPIASQLDTVNQTITIGKNIEFIMINIKKVALEQHIQLQPIQFPIGHGEFKKYCQNLATLLKTSNPWLSLLLYMRDYYLVPLLITGKTFTIGIIIWCPSDKIIEKCSSISTIVESYNYLSNVISNTKSKSYVKCKVKNATKDATKANKAHKDINNDIFDIMLGIIAYDSRAISSLLPVKIRHYIMNCHAYLPRFKVIRRQEAVPIIKSFQNHLDL